MRGIRWINGGDIVVVTINKKIDLQKYKEDKNNVNKVAIYNIDEGMIVEEGVLNLDNYTGTLNFRSADIIMRK